MRRLGWVSIVVSLVSAVATGAPQDQDIFTSFEGIASSDFTIGVAPEDAHFTGGFSNILGILQLYHTGAYGWMVDPGQTGLIEFTTNAAEVEFYARTRSLATGSSVLTSYNDVGTPLEVATVNPGDAWKLVKFVGSIDHITFENQDSSHMNSIDDFGYSLPEPIIPGDANENGFVDDVDLAILLGNWESDPLIISTWSLGNFTEVSLGDTDVDDSDLAVLLGNWTGPPPSGAAVPEPATLALLGLGGLAVLRRRRK